MIGAICHIMISYVNQLPSYDILLPKCRPNMQIMHCLVQSEIKSFERPRIAFILVYTSEVCKSVYWLQLLCVTTLHTVIWTLGRPITYMHQQAQRVRSTLPMGSNSSTQRILSAPSMYANGMHLCGTKWRHSKGFRGNKTPALFAVLVTVFQSNAVMNILLIRLSNNSI